MDDDEMRHLATKLTFENKWDVWVKANTSAWELKEMKHVFTVHTIADMWSLLNNIPTSYVGVCNIFLMHSGVKPLWETNGALFRNGGCWSVVIRKHAWKDVIDELIMSLLGEAFFGENIKGACIVPVSMSHVICKIWCVTKSKRDSISLLNALETFDASGARFKEFAL